VDEIADAQNGIVRALVSASSKFGYGPHWEMPVFAFDEALEEAVRTDDLLATALENGFPRAEVTRLMRGAEGLRRVFALDDEVNPVKPEERPRVLFEALVRIEELVRATGAVALPFRARLRMRALPGRLGDALAALDFERCYAIALAETQPVHVDDYLELAATYAAEGAPSSLVRARAARLHALGAVWTHELMFLNDELAKANRTDAERESILKEQLARRVELIRLRPDHQALSTLLGARLDEDLALSPADRDRLQHPRSFAPPRPR